MKKKEVNNGQVKACKINNIEATTDCLTARGGLFFLNKYVENTELLSRLEYKFSHIKDSTKGLSVKNYFKQLISFDMDGTKSDLTYFDELKADASYSELLGIKQSEMASSHQIKRMTGKFENSKRHTEIYRDILSDIFIHMLISEQPDVVEIGIDTMILDNDDSKLKEGCDPTYKGVKGFQPLQAYWNGMIIDAIFRDGKCHSNHSDHVKKMIKKLVKKIRKSYRKDVPIILKMDSGFLSDENFTYFEEVLKIKYICVGKMYNSIKDYIGELPVNNRKVFSGSHDWEYIEFGNKLGSWSKFRRAVYVQQVTNNMDQIVLDFARSDRIIYTNIGMDVKSDESLYNLNVADYFAPEFIIKQHHARAIDELVNRELKNFMTKEKLPFRAFSSNQVFYFMQVISFSLMRSFQKEIILDDKLKNIRPENFRRVFIDIAGKIVSHAGQKILKLKDSIFEKLKLGNIFERLRMLNQAIAYS
ncbi:MAG: IS1380 family transposase [Candidatus Cloacimonadota bacterium]|nr:IS1380 family transposase [Candidatus Cloacimonadota bacterium]